jgi:hypothetical protein
LNYYTFSDELTPLDMNSLSYLANGCCVQKLIILDEKLLTQDYISQNEFYCTLEQKSIGVETGVASRPKRLA